MNHYIVSGEMYASNVYKQMKVPVFIFSNTCTEEIYAQRKENDILFWNCFILIRVFVVFCSLSFDAEKLFEVRRAEN